MNESREPRIWERWRSELPPLGWAWFALAVLALLTVCWETRYAPVHVDYAGESGTYTYVWDRWRHRACVHAVAEGTDAPVEHLTCWATDKPYQPADTTAAEDTIRVSRSRR